MLTRRAFLGAAALVPFAGCGGGDRRAPAVPPASPPVHADMRALERRFGATLGVHARDTGSGRELVHRADERFAFCSAFKGLAAAAVLDRRGLAGLDRVLRYEDADLMESSFVTREHVASGLPLRRVLDAAVRYSDGTAGNLLLREIGGPRGLTRYLRGLGDERTRCDRYEPEVADIRPGDPRDTTTPRAIAADYEAIVLGDALPRGERAHLRDLLERNTTGARRIRAGVPRGWRVADRTGTSRDYGAMNDIAIMWPPGTDPLVLALMSRRAERDAEGDEALLAEAARVAVAALRP